MLAASRVAPPAGKVYPVSAEDRLIMVIDRSDDRAQNLKELIEFMDAPEVCAATPLTWQSRIGEHRLAAIFVSEELPRDEMRKILDKVGRIDPNVPIVLVDGEHHA